MPRTISFAVQADVTRLACARLVVVICVRSRETAWNATPITTAPRSTDAPETDATERHLT